MKCIAFKGAGRVAASLAIMLLAANIKMLAQDVESIRKMGQLYGQKRYEAAMMYARGLIAHDPNCAAAYELTGRCFIQLSSYDSAKWYLEKAILLDADTSYVSGWGHANLGYALICLGEKEHAVDELKRCIDLGMTANCVKYAAHILDSIGYAGAKKTYPKNYLPSWVVIEGRNITFNFQDTSGMSRYIGRYMKVHDDAYDTINRFFQARLPRKFVLYHWKDAEIAEKILHKRLAFANPRQCFCHTGNGHTVGHEMTHVLAHWAWGRETEDRSRFINEGVAVCYDRSGRDYYAEARKVIEKERERDVMDIWRHEKKYEESILYPVGGAFVYYLKEKLSPEQFKAVIKEQTIDNVKIVLGDSFYTLVSDFNRLMGMK